jgi:hypothetical protein
MEMKLIAAAFLKAQSEIQNALMDSTNPHFRNKYASLESVLEAVKPVANRNGIAVSQQCGKDEGGPFVKTVLLHTSGETMESKTYLLLDKTTMQGLGSAISYGRRYDLASIFAITQEDDDGNAAVGSQPPRAVSKSKSAKEVERPEEF